MVLEILKKDKHENDSKRFVNDLAKKAPSSLKEGSVPIGHPLSTLGSNYSDLLKALPPSTIIIVDGQFYAVPI